MRIIIKAIKWVYWKIVYFQDGKKVYLFCLSSIGGIAYVHYYYPKFFGFTKKELLYLGLALVYAFLNRIVQSKLHGNKIARYL